jgi:hypothetical protein
VPDGADGRTWRKIRAQERGGDRCTAVTMKCR